MATVPTAREQAHELIDLIDRTAPSQVMAVVTLLESMLDPFAKKLANAPWEDEFVSDEEAQAVAASHRWLQSNIAIPNEDLLAEFGLSEEEFERLGKTPFPTEF